MFVFATLHVPPAPLQKDSLFHIIEKIGLRAAVQNCHPHRFRHTFAIKFLRNGGNIYTLSLQRHCFSNMIIPLTCAGATEHDIAIQHLPFIDNLLTAV
jgi:integrase